MGAAMKEVMAKFGGRGGGSRDMAQGGLSDVAHVDPALAAAKAIFEIPEPESNDQRPSTNFPNRVPNT
jgi:hypothetical protein